jgi:hypothetical protein
VTFADISPINFQIFYFTYYLFYNWSGILIVGLIFKKFIFLITSRQPSGCLQYSTGLSGRFTTFNFAGVNSAYQHLANQNYRYCVRQALGKIWLVNCSRLDKLYAAIYFYFIKELFNSTKNIILSNVLCNRIYMETAATTRS